MRAIVSLIKRLPLGVVFLFFPAVLAAAELASCDYGDAIVNSSISDARTLIPILASDSASAELCGMIYNGLVKYDKDINIIGDLADSWEILEGGQVIVFHLRKDVRWHDGAPFSASDVEFTYRKLIDPLVKTPYSGDFEKLDKFEIIDDYTIKLTYKEPFAPALSSWGMSIMPRHLLEKEDLNKTRFQRKPVGTGPYKFKTWKTQEKIELFAYSGYFEKLPGISRYITRVIPDEATAFLELETEGVDLSGLSPLQYNRQTDTAFFKERYNKFRIPSFGYTYLGYNLKDHRFADLRVRQALNLAVDKQELINMVMMGTARPCTGPFIPESWAYNEQVQPAPFSPAQARKLLKDAGWSDLDKDGWIEKDGRPFEFTIITNQGNEERIKAAQIIQRRLSDVGIRVKIQVLEWSVFISEYINKRNFEAVLLGWSLGRDPDNYDIWHSSKTGEGQFNFLGYSNKEVDELLIQARRNFDQQVRKSLYRKIHKLIYDDQPCMFLYVPDSLFILHKRFQNVKPAPLGISYNFIEWCVPRKLQRYATIDGDN